MVGVDSTAPGTVCRASDPVQQPITVRIDILSELFGIIGKFILRNGSLIVAYEYD